MRYVLSLPNFGEFSDPRLVAGMAHDAEETGWDGFFLWDHFLWTWPKPQPMADPWVTLAAVAIATKRILLGTMVTPVPRRRPWQLAREVATLDHLSGGRVILGVGIGGDWFGDYTAFGEPPGDKLHGEMLDEGLDVIAGLWSGKPFSYEGKHYQIKGAQFLPPPVQQPRVPIWVAGRWPGTKPFKRAAKWDGVFPLGPNEQTVLTPDDYRAMLVYINEHRTSDGPFELVHGARSQGKDRMKDAEMAATYAEVGVTCWLEAFEPATSLEEIRERVRSGPPRI